MLFELLDRVSAEIGQLNITSDKVYGAFGSQVLQHSPDVVAESVEHSKGQGTIVTSQAAATALGIMGLIGVVALPDLAKRMADKLRDKQVAAARRCALAEVLAYVVQPHDLIPDDAPGGYGYLDDVVLLRAGLMQYLNERPLPGVSMEAEMKYVAFLIRLTPMHVRQVLQQSIASMSVVVQVMEWLPAPIAEFTLGQIIANPLQVALKAPQGGFVPTPLPNYDPGFIGRSGAYIQGGSIVMPGGPALIDGRLFIPD
jgi:uncharacterized membrane protein YkvA (DUF1232 family)